MTAPKRSIAPRKNRSSRRAQIERSLQAKDPLGELHLLINDKLEPGKTFALAYACILETNSATLAILFDRFSHSQLSRLAKVLKTIGATKTLTDFLTLKSAFDKSLATAKSRSDAADALDDRAELRRVARRYNAHTSEMEERLLTFAKAHLRELAAAKPTVAPDTARFIRNALARADRAAPLR